jgi:hypothetical protein
LRKRLVDAGQKLQAQLVLLLGEQGPLIRGSFGSRVRKCGNPGCHCKDGQGHESKFLGASEAGTVRQVHVPASEESMVAKGVQRYRRFRQRREELKTLCAEQLELVDELGRSLLMPYPRNNPLPPAKHLGPKPRRPKD